MHETNTPWLPTPIESFSRAGALSGPDDIKEATHQHPWPDSTGPRGGRRATMLLMAAFGIPRVW